MSNVRCAFCGRYYKKDKNSDKCRDCPISFKSILERLRTQYNEKKFNGTNL